MTDVERTRMQVSPASTDALLDPLKVRAGCAVGGGASRSPENVSLGCRVIRPRRRTDGSPPSILPRAQASYLSLADDDGTMTHARALFALAGPSPRFPRARVRRVFRNNEHGSRANVRSAFASFRPGASRPGADRAR